MQCLKTIAACLWLSACASVTHPAADPEALRLAVNAWTAYHPLTSQCLATAESTAIRESANVPCRLDACVIHREVSVIHIREGSPRWYTAHEYLHVLHRCETESGSEDHDGGEWDEVRD